ncbi:hypothetical protein Trydic_g5666 [Trypoxylus dichotomus]
MPSRSHPLSRILPPFKKVRPSCYSFWHSPQLQLLYGAAYDVDVITIFKTLRRPERVHLHLHRAEAKRSFDSQDPKKSRYCNHLHHYNHNDCEVILEILECIYPQIPQIYPTHPMSERHHQAEKI